MFGQPECIPEFFSPSKTNAQKIKERNKANLLVRVVLGFFFFVIY